MFLWGCLYETPGVEGALPGGFSDERGVSAVKRLFTSARGTTGSLQLLQYLAPLDPQCRNWYE